MISTIGLIFILMFFAIICGIVRAIDVEQFKDYQNKFNDYQNKKKTDFDYLEYKH